MKTHKITDFVVDDPNQSWAVSPENIFYICGWSPFEGVEFSNKVIVTFVNGEPLFRIQFIQ